MAESDDDERFVVIIDFSDEENVDEDIEQALNEGSGECKGDDLDDDFIAMAGGPVYLDGAPEAEITDSAHLDYSFLKVTNPVMHKFLSSQANPPHCRQDDAVSAGNEQIGDMYDALFEKTLRFYDTDDDVEEPCNTSQKVLKDGESPDEIAKAILKPFLAPKEPVEMSRDDKNITLALAFGGRAKGAAATTKPLSDAQGSHLNKTGCLGQAASKNAPKLIRLVRANNSAPFDQGQTESDDSDQRVSDDDDSVCENLPSLRRVRGETLEEKRARKAVAKAQRMEARIRKSTTRQYFKRAAILTQRAEGEVHGQSLSRIC